MDTQPPSIKPSSSPDLGELLGKVLLVGLGLLASYKVYQAATDEEYDRRTLPKRVRHRLLAEHLETTGDWCDGHGREGHFVTVEDLTVDHIVPWSRGGLTSVHNSQVLCRSCNSNKGSKHSLFDSVRGR